MTTDWLADVRDAPSRVGLAHVAETVAPGSRVQRVRRLGGGLGAAMHRFDLVTAEGERQRLVLRRYPAKAIEESPQKAERAWRMLGALEQLGVPAPRPVWADLAGEVFGKAAYVMTWVPGHSDLRTRDLDGWLRQLAAALATLHRIPLGRVDLSFLRQPVESLERSFAAAMEERLLTHPQGAVLQEALARWRPRLRRMQPVICHGDYWAGNTLWRRGRLVAIVDWDAARLAYPGLDVGYCRMDLAMQHSLEAAGRFLGHYEAAAGMRVPQLDVWDLLGAAVALPDPERWLPGFHELGRADITAETANARLSAFIADALARS